MHDSDEKGNEKKQRQAITTSSDRSTALGLDAEGLWKGTEAARERGIEGSHIIAPLFGLLLLVLLSSLLVRRRPRLRFCRSALRYGADRLPLRVERAEKP
ncbi:hypothetical protein M432DRAFT_638770 [Thermoascus aurantiacus ATCC 26904]